MLFQFHYPKILRAIMKLARYFVLFTKRFEKKSPYQSWKRKDYSSTPIVRGSERMTFL